MSNHNHYESVKEFMQKAGQATPDKPVIPDEETRLLRASLIIEEVLELLDALGCSLAFRVADEDKIEMHVSIIDKEPDLVAIADGVADVTYVTTGTALALGLDIKAIQEEVDRSNLDKFRGDAHKDENGKWIKPSDWTPPDIEGIIKRQQCCNRETCNNERCCSN